MGIDINNLPLHIGIIMDGNRRWAKLNGKPIPLGHKAGAETLEKIARYANKIGLKYMTVFAFSTENWKRSEEEVSALMALFQNYINKFTKVADSDNIKIKFIGNLDGFSEKIKNGFLNFEEITKNNTGLQLNIAVNYGGRAEIIEATKKIAEDVSLGKCKIEDIDENMISNNLYTAEIPDVDLIIRTSGEIRTSGFLTWKSVYSELLFVKKYWPDFNEEDLDNAIIEYQKRTRNFGGK